MTATRPVVIVAGRHRPHEQLFLAWSALIGVSYLVWAPPPTFLSASLPHPLLIAWSAALAVSGIIGLTGCWLRGERGLGVELGGMLINTGALIVYAVSVFSLAGTRALLPGGIVLAWAVANLWRAAQAVKDIRAIRDGA